jgi:hypothetical protein
MWLRVLAALQLDLEGITHGISAFKPAPKMQHYLPFQEQDALFLLRHPSGITAGLQQCRPTITKTGTFPPTILKRSYSVLFPAFLRDQSLGEIRLLPDRRLYKGDRQLPSEGGGKSR